MFVQTKSLCKIYGSFQALVDCDLSVEQGEVFGLLGPNGAGKTTLLRLLMGFLRPTSGEATIDGEDCYHDRVNVHRKVAYLPGDARLFRSMKGKQVLKFFAHIRAESSIEASLKIAKRLELDINRRVGFMSTGMRQKLAIAATLAADVPLIILDEPTANLDPTVRQEVTRLVLEAKALGKTVIFSSHVLSEIEETCDRVVILRAGKLVHMQTIAELRRSHRVFAQLEGRLPTLPDSLSAEAKVLSADANGLLIESRGPLTPLMRWLSSLSLTELRVEPVGLRALYDRFHGPHAEPDPDDKPGDPRLRVDDAPLQMETPSPEIVNSAASSRSPVSTATH